MAQLTAVEWLVNELLFIQSLKEDEITESNKAILTTSIFEQAKQMEKEQIITAHLNGQAEFDKEEYRLEVIINAGKYYNETYGGQGSPDTSPNTQKK